MRANLPIKKTPEEIHFYTQTCYKFGKALYELYSLIKSGRATNGLELEVCISSPLVQTDWDIEFPFSHQKNPLGEEFGAPICISINDVVAHAVPTEEDFIPGDIISIDYGISLPYGRRGRRLHYDSAFTITYDTTMPEWVKAPQYALREIVKTVNEICKITEETAEAYNLDVIVSLTGHGIGYSLHELPLIHNKRGDHPDCDLFEGLVFCVEPIFALPGKMRTDSHIARTCMDSNGWSVRTMNGQPSSHFESMFCISNDNLVDLVGVSRWDL
jgi:methionine aminopeptidase